jgi:hypothetical protein
VANPTANYVSFAQLAIEKNGFEGKMRSCIEAILDRAHKFAVRLGMTKLRMTDNNNSRSPSSSPSTSPIFSQRFT